MSQKTKILEYMQRGNSITPIDALSRFGCFRLSAIIYSLKDEGHTFSREMIKNKHGNHFAKYTLEDK